MIQGQYIVGPDTDPCAIREIVQIFAQHSVHVTFDETSFPSLSYSDSSTDNKADGPQSK